MAPIIALAKWLLTWRQIMNKILAKTMHKWNLQKQRNNHLLLLKLEMNIAYDRRDWLFLQIMMLCYGSNQPSVRLVIHYVITVFYFMLVNGRSHGYIILQKMNQIRGSLVSILVSNMCKMFFLLHQEERK